MLNECVLTSLVKVRRATTSLTRRSSRWASEEVSVLLPLLAAVSTRTRGTRYVQNMQSLGYFVHAVLQSKKAEEVKKEAWSEVRPPLFLLPSPFVVLTYHLHRARPKRDGKPVLRSARASSPLYASSLSAPRPTHTYHLF